MNDFTLMLSNLRENKTFLAYIEKLQEEVCDIRKGKYGDNETRLAISQFLQDKLIDKIKLHNEKKDNGDLNFE